ncbi:MAG: ABC transporter substrate-binding protein [Lachnospiraceae bacterium]|nr:ABC transporter substrate-binding protein [Lachnospiraceae bacterium]
MKRRTAWVAAAILAASMGLGMTVSAGEPGIDIGALKGPTSMGLVSMIEKKGIDQGLYIYNFSMVTAADELVGKVISGEVDIALVPANVASVLYNKTEAGVRVIDINTLGVLYVVECGDAVQSVSDLAGKTVYLTGKGTTPDYVLQYLLEQNGLTTDDVTLEYKSEATEVVSVLAEDPTAIGLLPQPFVTAAGMQNENLRIALDLADEWAKLQGEGGSSLVTGVTVVRTDYLESDNEFGDPNEDAVKDFLKEHKESVSYTNANPAEAAELTAKQGIVANAEIAEKAIPYCNITCIQGEEMKTALEGYLQVLADMDPASIGGSLPGEDFYYIP